MKSIKKTLDRIANTKKRAPRSKQQHHEISRIRTKAPWEHQTYWKHHKITKIRLKTLGKEAPWSKQKHKKNIRIKILLYWGDGKWECCNVEAKKMMVTIETTKWEHYDAKAETTIITTTITKREHYNIGVNIATKCIFVCETISLDFDWIHYY